MARRLVLFVRDALEDSPQAAEDMRIRAELLREALRLLRESGLVPDGRDDQGWGSATTHERPGSRAASTFSSNALVAIIGAFGNKVEMAFPDAGEAVTATGYAKAYLRPHHADLGQEATRPSKRSKRHGATCHTPDLAF